MEILKNLTSEFQSVNKIESQLFNVAKIPLIADRYGFDAPSAYGIYKTDGGKALGVVGNDYNPQQPKVLFNMLLESLYHNESLDLSKLKYTEMKEGKKIRFSIPVGRVEFINKQGKLDESIVTLNLQTGFDGLTKTSLYLSTYRMICANGMKASVTEFQASFKNTKGNMGKAGSLILDVNKQISQITKLEEMYVALNNVSVKQADIDKYIEMVTGYNLNERSEFSTRKSNILTQIENSINLEISRTGNTLFGLFNGITHYTNHTASGSQDTDFIFVDNGAKLNDKALKVALELAK